MEKTYAYAYFSLWSGDDSHDFPLEIVTERLGVIPTKTRKKGERTPYKPPITHFRFTSWEYGTDNTDTLDVYDVLNLVIDMLEPRIDDIILLKKELNLRAAIHIVIHIHDGFTPGLGVETRASRVAAAIDANIDIDLYAYPYEELDDDFLSMN